MFRNQGVVDKNFFAAVYRIARKIPRGKVASYGQIAALISTPRAARIVGFAMRRSPEDVPWHRVISSSGRISIENVEHPAEEQARLLRGEGVEVKKSENSFVVDMKRFLWKPASR